MAEDPVASGSTVTRRLTTVKTDEISTAREISAGSTAASPCWR
ncbi:hypothetical protein ACPCUK_36005 [Streptomyces arboris]